MTFEQIRRVIAAVFLAGFVAVWAWIALKLFRFDATEEMPKLVLDAGFAEVAGFLSTTVAGGTAAALGIDVQKVRADDTVNTTGAAVAGAVAASPLIVAGIFAYLAVAILLIVAWLSNGATSPEIVEAFALGALGWMAGAFVGVFATSENT